MALSLRFNDVSSGIVHVSLLEVNHKYPIKKTEKVTTRYGETTMLSIRDSTAQQLYKVFLPKRYAMVFQDGDIKAFNDGSTAWNLVHKGQCPKTNSYLLAIEWGIFIYRWIWNRYFK